jgi:hypothetical protein
MTGRYEYEVTKMFGGSEKLRADEYYEEGDFFKFVVYDDNGSAIVKHTIKSGLVQRVDQIGES